MVAGACRLVAIEPGERLRDKGDAIAAARRASWDCRRFRAAWVCSVNRGFGNTDLANLSLHHLDLEHGWCNYPRPKTAVRRRCPLWPETIVAISAAIAERPTPKDKSHANLVFISPRGHMLVHTRLRTSGTEAIDLTGPSQITYTDRVIANMTPLLRRLGLTRRGLTFYALRHTFETIGGESRDQVAVDAIMGHSRDDMASVYRERISDERLKAVSEHVRAWLFGTA